MTLADLTWDEVGSTTAGPLWYAIPLLAVAMLFGREMWVTYRGTRSITLSVVTTALTVAGFAVVVARLLALAR